MLYWAIYLSDEDLKNVDNSVHNLYMSSALAKVLSADPPCAKL